MIRHGTRLLDLRHSVCSTGNSLLTRPALPDTDRFTFDGHFATETASVSRVLGDFHLLHLLSEGGTVSMWALGPERIGKDGLRETD